jgi:hypothetical protein
VAVTAAARRMRRLRLRRAAGYRVIKVLVDDVTIQDALIARGLLGVRDAEDPIAIGAALSGLIALMTAPPPEPDDEPVTRNARRFADVVRKRS